MIYQADAVYKEVEAVGISGFVHHLQPGLVDLGPDRTGLDSPHGSTLCRLDLGQHVFEFGIRLALNGHAANITDITVVIPPGIDRHDFPVLPLLRRWGTIEALPRGDQAIFEDKTAIRLLTPQRIDHLLLGNAGAMPSITASMLSTTVSVASRSFRNSSGAVKDQLARIQVSENASIAVVMVRPAISRGTGLPRSVVPFTVRRQLLGHSRR